MNNLMKQLEKMEQDAIKTAKYQRDLGGNEEAMMHALGEATGLRIALALLSQAGAEVKAVRVLEDKTEALEQEVYVREIPNLFAASEKIGFRAYIRVGDEAYGVTVNGSYVPLRETVEEAMADARASVEFEHGWVEDAPLGDDPMGDE